MQTRLDLWLKTHVEKLLGPLFGLSKAEDITGIGARHRVPVDRSARRARTHQDLGRDEGSRPGLARHACANTASASAPITSISPALLKPAARALASLLWAEKQDNVDMSALSGAQHLASSGRTSFPVDKALRARCLSACSAIASAVSARCVSISWSVSPISFVLHLAWRESSPGEKPSRRVRRPQLSW